jgi:hypothetical protein
MKKTLSAFWATPLVPLAVVLVFGLLVTACLGSWTAFSLKGLNNTLSVTGSSQTAVTSDSVKFTLTIGHTVPESALAAGYSSLDSDLRATQAFLTSNGILPAEMVVSPALANKNYDSNNQNGPTKYDLTRTIVISSTRVDAVTALADKVSGLASQGVAVTASSPEYYYSKLSDLRVSLLGAALKDAKARADAIAKQSGQSVGRLQGASGGVVQVLAPNSITDVSDYGQYDTSSVQKEVMITVRATYFVR